MHADDPEDPYVEDETFSEDVDPEYLEENRTYEMNQQLVAEQTCASAPPTALETPETERSLTRGIVSELSVSLDAAE
mgnify:CR=1 FL=1